MARVSRTRTRTTSVSGVGSVWKHIGATDYGTTLIGPVNLGYETTADWHGGIWTDSPFTSSKGRVPPIRINGSHKFGVFTYDNTNVPENQPMLDTMFKPWLEPAYQRTPISSATLGAMAVASMNPSRADLSWGQTLGELHQLPELLRDLGRMSLGLARSSGAYPIFDKVMIKGGGTANVVAQFGILPIIRDVLGLLDFADAVAKREQVLRDMSRGYKRFHRKLTREEWTGFRQKVSGQTGSNNLGSTKANMTGRMHRTYWFTARAKLLYSIAERDIQSRAFRLGLELDDSQGLILLWELLPWSWLISWFTNLGVLVHAYGGGIPWQWQGINVMHETVYDVTCVYTGVESGIVYSPTFPHSTGRVLTRAQASGWAFPWLITPYLDINQMSILLSLGIMRLL